jgi:hypothetical protein
VDILALLQVLQVQHLHHDPGGRGMVDLADQEDDPVLEQQLVDRHFSGALVGDACGRHGLLQGPREGRVGYPVF